MASKPYRDFIEPWKNVLQAHQIPLLYFMKAKTHLVKRVSQASDLFYNILWTTFIK